MPGHLSQIKNNPNIFLDLIKNHLYRLIIEKPVLAPPDGSDGFHDGSTPQSSWGNLTLLSISVIAKMLGTSSETVRRWITHGRPVYGHVEYLQGIQVGTPWRVSESELQRFLSSIQTSPRARRVKIGGGGG